MKKYRLMLALIMMAAILVSCIELPEEPHEYAPWCKEQYQLLRADDPDYPKSFIGACVSTLHTGKLNAFASLCRYEPFRESLGLAEIPTHKECIQYIHTLEE